MRTNILTPTSGARRSFVYRNLLEAGVKSFVQRGEAILADTFITPDEEQSRLEHIAFADLSPLPRIGFKGDGTLQWLARQGITIPDTPNRSLSQQGGTIVARLGETEVLILGNPVILEGDPLPQKLYDHWHKDGVSLKAKRGFPLLRGDSHACFVLSGRKAPVVLAKICGMDLRSARFGDGSAAQTMLCGISAIVIRGEIGALLYYYLLVESSFASYFFDHLLAVSRKSGGGPVGLSALTAPRL